MKRERVRDNLLRIVLISLIALPFILVSSGVVLSQEGASLTLEKDTFTLGEPINVTFTAPSTFGPRAWVGIIPSDVPHGDETVNDQYDIAYKYLNGMTSGVLMFTAPTTPGTYDLRMHDTDSSGVEVTYVTFNVTGSAEYSLELDKYVFAPGEAIKVKFTTTVILPSNAWIGIIPSDVPHGDETVNDQYDVSYQYIGGMLSGELMFSAPSTPGSYDFRMHDTDSGGAELVSVTFTVE